ncbi:ankyrin repeat domain-containing protein [Micavibrio aeruginosavorus]|uniref:Ankyrin repeat family protein n=1 Tax=Micavibrio aeruginosavorus (strain ARL-13) TaxID=856793 RepID=G2KMK2_MICAA|nr:ankyrin repeat domain-containing protein [Micavibrio aeruginosavorus]AEP10695.1 ankyrin repeat family protein [Micavibrio aeruginosavorus ARL-13]
MKRLVILFLFFLTVSSSGYAEIYNSPLLSKAESGDVCAQAKIAHNYAYGSGGARLDYAKAIEWYEKAVNVECKEGLCSQCQKEAFRSFGLLYKRKSPISDEKKAFYWLKKAAESGNTLAFKNMAEYYAEGRVVKRDYERAYYWITRGKAQGAKTSYDDFIVEIKAHLTPAKIQKIDEENQKFIEEMAMAQRNAFADMMDKTTLGFNPNADRVSKANARLAFEIGLNKSSYDLVGVQKLIDSGALTGGYTPKEAFLFMAIKNNDPDLVRLLLRNGIDPNSTDGQGVPALYKCGRVQRTNVALALIEAGANVNASNERGSSILMDASRLGNIDLVRALVQKGADINAVENDGPPEFSYDALYYALTNRNQKIAEILMQAGAVHQKKHDKFNKNRDQPEACSREKKLCPDGREVSLAPPSCAFPTCLQQKEKEIYPIVKGTFSEVDKRLSDEAIHILANGSIEEKNGIAHKIRANPSAYNPAALRALSKIYFAHMEDKAGAFWYMVADMRNRYDSLICKNKESAWNVLSFDFSVKQFKPYAEHNPDTIQKIYENVIIWDQNTPYAYDSRWRLIGNGKKGYSITDSIPDDVCVSPDRFLEFQSLNRDQYARVIEQYVKKFDVRKEPLNQSAGELTALLKKAEAGDREAQYQLIYQQNLQHLNLKSLKDRGEHVEKWLKKSSAQGYAPATALLGKYYTLGFDYFFRGHGGAPQTEKGLSMLKEAGANGYIMAYFYLSEYYRHIKDPAEAYAWVSVAAILADDGRREIYESEKTRLASELKGHNWENAQKRASALIRQYKKE